MSSITQLIKICGIISIIFAIVTVPALAGLGTSVPSIEANIIPGEEFLQEITIYNDGQNQSMDITAEVCGMTQEPDGTTNAIAADSDAYKYSARPFLNITPATFHIEPGAESAITLKGLIPQDIGEGGRYALLSIRSTPLGQGMVGIALSIEIPVKLSISGTDHTMTGKITGLEICQPISANELKAILKFNNTGNYHYKANARAEIKDHNGYSLANATLPLGFSNIIPLSMRSVEFTLIPDQELKKGSYYLEIEVAREDNAILDAGKLEFTIK